jgi:predicted phosphodiesterase
MKILALYDIHANVEALEAVLADPRAADPDVALVGGDAALVVAGHTHQHDDRVVGDVRFVNAGSVGLPYEGDGAARWLWIVDGEPEPRQTEYDAAATGRRMLDGGWPDARSTGAALIEPIAPEVITRLFEDRASG